MRGFLSVLVLLALAGCAKTVTEPGTAEITGEAVPRELLDAPPDARLEVVLEDISRADAPAERLGATTLENAGDPPYRFTIDYDASRIDPRHSYRVRARLLVDDELLAVTDEVHQVITRGHPNSVTLRLRQVGETAGNPLGALPATFAGILPCADCPGIEYHLNLLEDGVFFLRQNYQDREGGPFDDIGRYLLSSDGTQLTLHGNREAPVRFAIVAPDSLRLLNQDGQPIESELNYTLGRQSELQPLEPSLLLRGMYRYMAGSGRFVECATGLEMPVAQEADNSGLESAYLEAQSEPGAPLLVSVEGRIAQRMPMEGPGPIATLVPERFIDVSSDRTCPPRFERAELEETYWRLTLVDSAPVLDPTTKLEPHLVFGGESKLAGSDGCNRLIGQYSRDDASINISGLATTRMACLKGMAEAERFRDALERVSQYRIVGQHLELRDADNTLRLRFEAVRPASDRPSPASS